VNTLLSLTVCAGDVFPEGDFYPQGDAASPHVALPLEIAASTPGRCCFGMPSCTRTRHRGRRATLEGPRQGRSWLRVRLTARRRWRCISWALRSRGRAADRRDAQRPRSERHGFYSRHARPDHRRPRMVKIDRTQPVRERSGRDRRPPSIGGDGRPLAPAGSSRDLFLHTRPEATTTYVPRSGPSRGSGGAQRLGVDRDGIFGPVVSERFREPLATKRSPVPRRSRTG
jgi:hypothetical protein